MMQCANLDERCGCMKCRSTWYGSRICPVCGTDKQTFYERKAVLLQAGYTEVSQ
jgi:hypothetical protein